MVFEGDKDEVRKIIDGKLVEFADGANCISSNERYYTVLIWDDLTGSMGIPGQFDNEEYLKTIEEIKSIGQRVQKPGGIHIVEPDLEAYEKAKENYTFIAYSVDFRMLDVSSRIATKKTD